MNVMARFLPCVMVVVFSATLHAAAVFACSGQGQGCVVHTDCCGTLECNTKKTCGCNGHGQPCSITFDCCNDFCNGVGTCGCNGPGQPCSGDADCCSTLSCNNKVCASGSGGGGSGGSGAGGGSGGSGGSSNGDPHIETTDGLLYDFQAAGEFVLATDDQSFMIQVRQQPYASSTCVAVNTATAMMAGPSRVAIYASWPVPLWIDGVPYPISCSRPPSTSTTGEPCHVHVPLPEGAGVDFDEATTGLDAYTITWPDGTRDALPGKRARSSVGGPSAGGPPGAASVTVVNHNHAYLNIQVAWGGVMHGLLGGSASGATNGIVTREGGLFFSPVTFAQFYGDYGESWRIAQAESLFNYGSGESTDTFTNRAFPRALCGAASLPEAQRQAAEATCRTAGVSNPALLDACTLDVAVMGDPSAATAIASLPPPRAVLSVVDPNAPPSSARGCTCGAPLGASVSGALVLPLGALLAARRRRARWASRRRGK